MKTIQSPKSIFPQKEVITFKFLKFIHEYVRGLEVSKNKYWEWDGAILDGARVFHELCCEQQGTVTVDMQKRTLSFSPHVHIDVNGTVCGIGASLVHFEHDGERLMLSQNAGNVLTSEESERGTGGAAPFTIDHIRTIAVKRAILEALTCDPDTHSPMLRVKLLDSNRVSVKPAGAVRERMWERRAISFKITLSQSHNAIGCTALVLADPNDSVAK